MRAVTAVVGLLLSGILLSSQVVIARMTEERVTTQIVRDGERVCSGSGTDVTCKYLAFGSMETFQNADSWAFLKFNSSDIHGVLSAGKTCDLRVSGWRIPMLSSYRNIIEATCQ